MKDCRDCGHFTTPPLSANCSVTYCKHYCAYYDERIKNFTKAETCVKYKDK